MRISDECKHIVLGCTVQMCGRIYHASTDSIMVAPCSCRGGENSLNLLFRGAEKVERTRTQQLGPQGSDKDVWL